MAPYEPKGTREVRVAHYAMAIDAEHCTGCGTCVVACQMEHRLRPGVAWLRVDPAEQGRWPGGVRLSVPHACLQCENPPCVHVCPTGASLVGDDGVVDIEQGACIGCGVCLVACPYGARSIARADAHFFGAPDAAPYESRDAACLGVAQKCDLCRHRRLGGREPACVQACPVGVRAFGDLDDPADPIHDFIAQTQAEPVPGTRAWYAHPTYGSGIDPGDFIVSVAARRHEGAASGVGVQAGGRANPAVLAGALAATGLAVGASALATGSTNGTRPSNGGCD